METLKHQIDVMDIEGYWFCQFVLSGKEKFSFVLIISPE